MLILLVAALVILGPERLPGAVAWTARALRQVRDYATGATNQLRDEFGPEFDEIRKPLSELNKMRGMTPRAAITKHLLDGDDFLFTGESNNGSTGRTTGRSGTTGTSAGGTNGGPSLTKKDSPSLAKNEPPPVDPDAT